MTKTEHLLAILAEECNEVAQRATKALRFGLTEIQSGQSLNNAERIGEELADLLAVVEMLAEWEKSAEILLHQTRNRIEAKKAKVERFLALSAQCGTLEER